MRFRYTGQQLIAPLNLYYYKARIYSPTLGRFLQTDPIGQQDDMNLYAYVGNNAINSIDPTGLYEKKSYFESLLASDDTRYYYIPGSGQSSVGSAFGKVDLLEINPLMKATQVIGLGPHGGKVSMSPRDIALAKAEARAAKLSVVQRDGKGFTKAGKEAVIDLNKLMNNGSTTCTTCGTSTVPAKQSQKGVTPPKNETQVDHKIAKSKGGSGTPDQGQVLCRDCNIKKSNH